MQQGNENNENNVMSGKYSGDRTVIRIMYETVQNNSNTKEHSIIINIIIDNTRIIRKVY